jgi:hypothetical protein
MASGLAASTASTVTAAAYRHQRLIPYLVEHRHPRLRLVERAQRTEAFAETRRCGTRCLPRAGQVAQPFQIPRHILDALGLGQHHRQAKRLQLLQMRGAVAAFPGDDQVRPQCRDGFEIDFLVTTDARYAPGSFGIIAEVHRADDPLACADGEKVLGDVWRQADDAPRRLGQTHCLAGIVLDHDLGCGRRSGQHRRQNQCRAHGEKRD